MSPHPLVAGLRPRTGASAGRFVRGLVMPLRAIAFLSRHPRLWPLVVVPALINLVLFVVAAGLVVTYAGDVLAWLWPRPGVEGVLDWGLVALWYAFGAILVVAGFLAAYVLVLLLGGVLASPFTDALSERTEALLTGAQPAAEGSWLAGALQAVGHTAKVTALYLLLLAPILLLHLVPAVGNLAATVLGAALGAFFIALEFSDAAFSRRGLSLGAKTRLLRAHLASTMGVGLGASALLWIPLVNVFCIPLAVVSGTVLAVSLTAPAAGAGSAAPR